MEDSGRAQRDLEPGLGDRNLSNDIRLTSVRTG